MKTDDGGPAFPGEKIVWDVPNHPSREIGRISVQGMTLKDYFAGQALIGLLANNSLAHIAVADSFAIADMMIEARGGHGRPTGEA